MPQVQLNTRLNIETHIKLKDYAKASGKSLANIIDEALNKYLEEDIPMTTKYRGLINDDLKTLETKYTKWYQTYKEAHDAAEKLCKRTMGDRGSIDVETK